MEEDMEVEVFEVVEIDLDYEFEAARFFDFTREETEEEACEAELWFETAKSYPPSPFVAKLFSMEEIFSENVNVSPKLKFANDQPLDERDETLRGSCRELAFYDNFSNHVKDLKIKPSVKPSLPRSSTLMKPTASQLAKQNPRSQVGGSRFQNISRTFNVHSGVEIQASKRQKLDGGQLRKVSAMKPQNILIHKMPKKDGMVPGVSHNMIKITIPLEPDLVTANRAQRVVSTKKDEHPAGRAYTFKARPLNRKILKAPTLPLSKKSTPRLPEFEVFHLKTMERAMQHSHAVKSDLLHQPYKDTEKACGDPSMDSKSKFGSRSKAVNTRDDDVCKAGHSFKARPLEKKIFTSKGDMGVFKNNKRAVTVPKEFEFQTDKRLQHVPLTELFGKLSLGPEVRSKISAPSKLSRPSCIASKGSKENRGSIFQQDHNIKYWPKD